MIFVSVIVVSVVVGIAVALCVAGWVPLVRDALRVDRVLPGPVPPAVVPGLAVVTPDLDAEPEAVTA